MKISEHFSLEEFEHSNTAAKHGIHNKIETQLQFDSITELCDMVLEPLRKHLGRSITISSGYRSEALNKHVGGSWTSQHRCVGNDAACDIVFDGMKENFQWIVDYLPFTQAIYEVSGNRVWIHIGYNRNHLKQKALTFNNGKYGNFK